MLVHQKVVGSQSHPGAEPETCLSLALGEGTAAAVAAATAARLRPLVPSTERKGSLATRTGESMGMLAKKRLYQMT